MDWHFGSECFNTPTYNSEVRLQPLTKDRRVVGPNLGSESISTLTPQYSTTLEENQKILASYSLVPL